MGVLDLCTMMMMSRLCACVASPRRFLSNEAIVSNADSFCFSLLLLLLYDSHPQRCSTNTMQHSIAC